MCGEKPIRAYVMIWNQGSPPRVRGKVHVSPGQVGGVGITPAYAGKRPLRCRPRSAGRDHPRVCGEKGYIRCRSCFELGSPPRVRGKVVPICVTPQAVGITPACAGKSALCASGGDRSRDHPRVCGEKENELREFAAQIGSPPRVRGKDVGAVEALLHGGITPACAGKRAKRISRIQWRRDHPRVCGEKYNSMGRQTQNPRITPACAGKSG